MIINRHGIAQRVHSAQARPGGAGSLLCGLAAALFNAWLALALAAFVLLVTWYSRKPSAPGGGRALSDAALTRAVLLDCAVASFNAFTLLEYVARPQVECAEAALAHSVGACILRGYWPATHLAFTTKWVGSAYPAEVVFLPELARALAFVALALVSTWGADGRAAALAPSFLCGLLARAAAGFAASMLGVAAVASRYSVDAAAAMPPQLLNALCPAPLRGARARVCAAAAAAVAAARRAAGMPARRSGSGDGRPTGVAAFSVAVTITLNEHPTLRAIGRIQVGLFVVGIALSLLGSSHGLEEMDAAHPDGVSPSRAVAVAPTLSWEEVQLEEALGHGSFATVFMARWRGTPVAVKRWRSSCAVGAERITLEAELIMALRHPNVLTVFGLLPPPRALVMERGACTLRDLLARAAAAPPTRTHDDALPWVRRVELSLGVAAGMDFLHAHDVIHGDLTCANVIISDAGVPKLADFGMSFVSVDGRRHMGSGTAAYAAPEVMRNFSRVALPKAADAFAFGVVLERVAVRASAAGAGAASSGASARSGSDAARPWASTMAALLALVHTPHLAQQERQVPSACPPQLARLVRHCCANAPEARPAFGAIRAQLQAALAEAEYWPAEGLT
jgi:tRNA A-37 threonylcarbamoyl transferase component Bud32